VPRLNIDDSLYSDPRFMRLCALLDGNYAAAIGFCVIAWTLGQKWYRISPNTFIPLAEWRNAHITEAFLSSGLAVRHEDGIEIVGADDHFGWLPERAAAGKKGGDAKARNHREKSLANASKRKQNVASYSYSYSYSKELNPRESSGDDPHPIFLAWNTHRGKLPEAKGMSPKRARDAAARWRENPSQEYWVRVVQAVVNSPFCCGNNDRGWKATFDWLLQPDTHLRALEGKYDNQKTRKMDLL